MRIFSLGAALSLVILAACTITSSGGHDNESCTAGAPCGSGSMQVCVDQDSQGACTGTHYSTPGGQSFACNSCSDCTSAVQSALASCEGGGSSSGSSSGGGSSGSGTNTTCTNGATCTGGSVMKVCTSTDATGACTAIAYTVGSQTFTCAGCSDCTAVQSQASQACAVASSSSGSGSGSGSGSSSGSGSGSSSGSGSGSSSGSSSGGSVPTYDGTTGKACQSDTDCHASAGPGVNVCSSGTYFQEGPVYPTPICLMPGNCDPGTDGNLHYCDGPDDSTSPGVCLATGTSTGICLPQCNFAPGGDPATGCVGKDTCYAAGYSADTTGTVLGVGYCFGGCVQNGDCPTGSQCQTNEGTCVTTLTAITAAETSCNSTTVTGSACDCLANGTTDLGFCTSVCTIGGAACAAGSVCDADLPTTLTDSAGATVTAWTTQNPGLAGSCVPTCVVGGTTVCPVNSTCQSATAAAPDCLP